MKLIERIKRTILNYRVKMAIRQAVELADSHFNPVVQDCSLDSFNQFHVTSYF